MEKVVNQSKLNRYISIYNISEIFSTDMNPFMELFVFNRGEYICRAEEKLDYLFFFVDGKAKVYTSLSNGKSLLLCFYKPFKVIGDVEFIHTNLAGTNVQVTQETFCIGISLERIREIALEDTKFLRYICKCLGEKLIRLGNYSSINLLYPLENRLASYIIATNFFDGKIMSKKLVFDGNLSEISELLGTSYRHLLRTLNKLCVLGAIKKIKDSYEVGSIEILKDLANDLYESD